MIFSNFSKLKIIKSVNQNRIFPKYIQSINKLFIQNIYYNAITIINIYVIIKLTKNIIFLDFNIITCIPFLYNYYKLDIKYRFTLNNRIIFRIPS